MGGWISYLLWGDNQDAVDPFSGLSRREVYIVKKTWTPLYEDCVFVGTELFSRLFRAHPHTKEFFRMIRKVPIEELKTNIQFKAHVINLMTALNLAVTNLHQPEVAAAMLNIIGESHHKRNITPQDFIDLKKILMDMLTEVLKMDSATLSVWDKTVDFFYKHIFETMRPSKEIT